MHVFRRSVSKVFPNAASPVDGWESLSSISQLLFQRKRLVDRSYPGAYIINPYLMRALKKLESLVDEHMHSIGAQRIMMPSLSPSSLWKKSGRWDMMGSELFTLKERNSNLMCLAPKPVKQLAVTIHRKDQITHEETVCSMVASHNLSYKSLPLLLYQITGKFRDEPHPKHGLLRGREFIMKDLYTFDENKSQALHTYNQVVQSYENIFKALSLNAVKVAADTGAIGGSMSHEFHLECSIGEDTLAVCQQCGHAINSELNTSADTQPSQCPMEVCSGKYSTIKGIELGHTFLLGERYSRPLNVTYRSKGNKPEFAYMGCYGIGITRLLAAAVEVLSTPNHMKMPRVISPYQIVILPQKKGYRFEETLKIAEDLYDEIERIPSLCGDIILDDRYDQSIGQRIREAKLMGFPMALCIAKQALSKGGSQQLVELIDLYEGESTMIPLGEITSVLSDKFMHSRRYST